MPRIKTNRSYSKSPDTDLSRFTRGVIVGLTNNTAYSNPPVNPAALGDLKTTFDDLIVQANRGGTLVTARKHNARAVLIDALNKDASYVDINCNDDSATLLSSGYEAVSTNRAQRVLNPPHVLAVENLQSGELKARISADPNAKVFLGRIKEVNGSEYGPSITFQNSRSILFKGLTAGLVYVFQLCAIGGSTGQSDWSSPSSGMAK